MFGEVEALEAGIQMIRNDLYAGSTCNRNCMRVLPQGKRSRQKTVLGEQSGVASVFSVLKHNICKIEFKTAEQPKPVGAIDLFSDQLFIANGSRINAYTRKGRPFFGLETNMAEAISNIRIETPFIFAGSDYVLTMFRECNELGFFLCPDKINSFLLKNAPNGEEGVFDVFLGCQDRSLRTARNTVKSGEIGCESPLQSLMYHRQRDHDTEKVSIVYGTLGGSFGGFAVSEKNELARTFSVMPERRLGGITSIACTDISQSGIPDIVLGRDDGSVELHVIDKSPSGAPKCIWQQSVSECVNAVDCGFVTNVVAEEILIHTYSGKVLTFSVSENSAAQQVVPDVLKGPQASLQQRAVAVPVDTTADPEAAPKQEVLQMKINSTTQEIRHLKDELGQATAMLASFSTGQRGAPMQAIASQFTVRDNFLVDSTALTLQLELNTPLDSVAIESDVLFDILDSESEGSNIVVSSNAPLSTNRSSKMLAVFRVSDESATMISLRLRPVEGQHGTIRAFVVPLLRPRTAQLRIFPVRPLSLHQRCSEKDIDVDKAGATVLRIQGQFTVKDMHSWIFVCLPEVPESVQGDEGRLYFRNLFQGTILAAVYRKGEAEFVSDNLSTLAIVKECITREATQRKIAVRTIADVHPETLPRHLARLHPKLEYQSRLAYQTKLLDGLREIQSQEQSTDFLTPDLQQTLRQAAEIEKENALQPRHLEFLHSILLRLLHDRAMFEGRSVTQSQERQLAHIVANYSPKHLSDFFLGA